HPGPGPHEHLLFLSLAADAVGSVHHSLGNSWFTARLGVKGHAGFTAAVIAHQPEVERHDISGCFKFLWIFGREGAGTHCGARTAWVNAVDTQALLIFSGQYLHHPFGGKFRRCICTPVGSSLTSNA